MRQTLRILDIVDGTTVDGPGFRTSIYFAGCSHRCVGCHNPQSWDASGGTEFTIDALMERIIRNDFDVTFSGGDPLLQIEPLIQLAARIRQAGKSIWCYTGYVFEDIAHLKSYRRLFSYVDVLVDGPFCQSLRDVSLLFRGSSNQRLIHLPSTLATGQVSLWTSDF